MRTKVQGKLLKLHILQSLFGVSVIIVRDLRTVHSERGRRGRIRKSKIENCKSADE
jgi:hypothetical protein